MLGPLITFCNLYEVLSRNPLLLYKTLKDLNILLKRTISELPVSYEWLCSNRLTLILSKRKHLVFQPRRKNQFLFVCPSSN